MVVGATRKQGTGGLVTTPPISSTKLLRQLEAQNTKLLVENERLRAENERLTADNQKLRVENGHFHYASCLPDDCL